MIPNKIGRYTIKGELGRGGMSTVYLAHDPHFERDVAIKLLPLELLHQPTFRQRFQREAKVVAALDHPAIVPVYDFGEEDGQPFLVMRFMMGGSLSERLRQEPMLIKEAAAIISRLAPALDEVHSHGVVHRDLKPSNILFDNRNDPYISDFGTAKVTQANTKLTETGGAVGTPAYMSPEQIQGDSKLDGRSDIYSLGVILFEMLTGKHPYQTNTPIAVAVKHIFEPVPHILDMVPNLPIEVQEVIGRAMAKEKSERYPTAVSFARALTKIANTIETHSLSLLNGEKEQVGKRYALVINNDAYQDKLLNQLVKNPVDSEALGALLKQPEIGHFDDVKVLNNQSTEAVRRHIARFFANKNGNDFLLLYYIGHAAMGSRGRIYLTTNNSEHNLLRGTTVSAQFIADEMDSCKSRNQILILDSHFSQAIDVENGRIIGQTVNVGANFTQNNPNRIVITASDSTQYMWENGTISGSARPSQFSKHLFEGLRSGAADLGDDGQISINELFSFVSEQVIRNSLDPQIQTPRKWSPFEPKAEGRVIIAHNVTQSQIQAAPVQSESRIKTVPRSNKTPLTIPTAAAPFMKQYGRIAIGVVLFIAMLGFVIGRGGQNGQNGAQEVVFAEQNATATATIQPTATQLPPLATELPTTTEPTATIEPTVTELPATETAVPPTATATAAAPTATPTEDATVTNTAVAVLSSSIYDAPSSDANEITFVAVDEVVEILGRSANGDWFYVRTQDDVEGFTYAPRYAWDGAVESLPIYEADGGTSGGTTAVSCAPNCPPLTIELYPLAGTQCDGSGKYRTVYIRGQGGNGRFDYFWDGSLLISNVQNDGHAFRINSPDGSSKIAIGKVVSGDGQTAELELFVGEFNNCG